ncbi:MAG TPA: hypothetical protein VFI73_13900 [Candidatus Nitrosopolaris sp.]|nr:hypothetical protein [Candidatus Nitrosopolaris sp.]
MQDLSTGIAQLDFSLDVTATIVAESNSGKGSSMLIWNKQSASHRRLAILIQRILSLQYAVQLKQIRKSQNYNTMPVYECNEHQFIENIRRLIETSQKFLVNRRIRSHDDDARYGHAVLPEELVAMQ